MFYCPTHGTRIVETENVRFIDNGETIVSETSRIVEIKEVRVQVPLTSTFISIIVVLHVVEPHNDDDEEEEHINDLKIKNEPIVLMLRYVILNDYVVYLKDSEKDLGIDSNPVSFLETINGDNSDK